MKKQLWKKVLSVSLSLTLLVSMAIVGFQGLMVSAGPSAAGIAAAAEAYVANAGNAATREGLLSAVQAVDPSATLEESDFYIKHAVNGCYDNDTQYPLNIPGSDGAVEAIFTVGNARIPFSAGIAHTMELIETTRTVVASRDSGEFDFGDGGVHPDWGEAKIITSYKGEGENLIVDVAFKSVGIKSLSAKFAPMKPVQ